MEPSVTGTGNCLGYRALFSIFAILLPVCLSSACVRLTPDSDLVLDDVPVVEANSPVRLEVLSAGLAGYISSSGKPFIIRYRITTSNKAERLKLSFYQKESAEYPVEPLPFMDRLGLAEKTVDLPAAGTVTGEWIIAQFNSNAYGSDVYLTARDEQGNVRAAAQVLDYRVNGRPIMILATDKEQGLSIEKTIRIALPEDRGQGVQIASMYNKLPDTWYEYEATDKVLLARPLSSLAKQEKDALLRWVFMGGNLLAAKEYVPDWTDETEQSFKRGIGSVQALSTLTVPDVFSVSSRVMNTLPTLLRTGYNLPDFRIFLAAVVLIILLIGPVLHIVFAKLHQREWLWVAAPLLSAAAALGMYGLAQAVKGDKSAVEIHHFFIGQSAKAPFFTTTTVRLQSAQTGDFDIRVEANEPTPIAMNDSYQYRNFPQARIFLNRGGVYLSKLFMRKWSTRDVTVESVGAPYPVERTVGFDGAVRIRNLGGRPLTELFYYEGLTWYKIEGKIESGQERTLSFPMDHSVNDNDSQQILQGSIGPALYSIRSVFKDWEILAATCEPSRIPKVLVSPAPAVVRESSHCVFLFQKPGPIAASPSNNTLPTQMKEAAP